MRLCEWDCLFEEVQHTESFPRTQVNNLSQVLLSLLLTPMLLSTGQSEVPGQSHFAPRLIFTGSIVAEMSPTRSFDVNNPFAGLDSKKRYKAADRYNESKVRWLSSL